MIYLAALAIWPNAGLGNNGHCDAWYYWGMSQSSEIVRNTISWDFYPASRAPLYLFGWLIPSSLDPIIWSKLLMLGNVLWPLIFIPLGLRRTAWKLAINSYLLASLMPIVFSQSSASYAGVTYNLLCILGLVLFLSDAKSQTFLTIGILSGLIIFSNVQTLVLVPPIVYLIFTITQSNRAKKFLVMLLGFFFSYFVLVVLLGLGGLTLLQSISFPNIQIRTLFNMIGEETFFGSLQNPWYVATPLMMFHISIILLLSNSKVRSLNIFPISLLKITVIQFFFLIFGQLAGLSVTFQSGFHAIFGYWVVVPLIYFVLVEEERKKNSRLFLIFFIFALHILISQAIFFTLKNMEQKLQLVTFSLLLPALCVIIWLGIVSFWEKFKSRFGIWILIFLPLLCMSPTDYSAAFYNSDNKPVTNSDTWSKFQYKAASQTVNIFSEKLSSSTAVGAIENPENVFQTSLLRASVRSFSSCGFAWSRFESLNDLLSSNSEKWPDHIILGSYRYIDDNEWASIFSSAIQIKRYRLEIGAVPIYWTEIFK